MPSSRHCSLPKSHNTQRCETGKIALCFSSAYIHELQVVVKISQICWLGHTPLATASSHCLATKSKAAAARFLSTRISGSYIHGSEGQQCRNTLSYLLSQAICTVYLVLEHPCPPLCSPHTSSLRVFPKQSSTSAPSWRSTEEKHSSSNSNSKNQPIASSNRGSLTLALPQETNRKLNSLFSVYH